ncbi:MAG: hypothetical protein V3V08_25855 [Nannocystaceae bacterium]
MLTRVALTLLGTLVVVPPMAGLACEQPTPPEDTAQPGDPAPAPAAGGSRHGARARVAADAATRQRLILAGEQYKRWIPVRPFVAAATVRGAPIDDQEAIVLTTDDHVGVTQDGGKTWAFSPHRHARVRDVAGYPEGPYVAAGSSGYVAISTDGANWRDLPRYTTDELSSVVAADAGIVAISKTGAFVHYEKDGSAGVSGRLPGKFRPTGLLLQFNGVLVATGRQGAYASGDGLEWTALESRVRLPEPNTATTRAGSCRLGKVGSRTGVICAVAGVAHGLPDDLIAIPGRGSISVSRDQGKTWDVSSLSREGIRPRTVVGHANGPLVAVGREGLIATSSDDGRHWIESRVNETRDFRAARVDEDRIVVVGEGGAILSSTDRGQTWHTADVSPKSDYYAIEYHDPHYYASSRTGVISSRDAITWRTADRRHRATRAKTRRCKRLPSEGQRCRYSRSSTTPRGLPDIRGLFFDGDRGLAVGDSSLVAYTKDGGFSWEISNGFGLSRIRAFAARGPNVLVTDGRHIVVSSDAGAVFQRATRPSGAGIRVMHIATDGTAYAAGRAATLLRSRDKLTWEKVSTSARRSTHYTAIFEVGAHLYLAGAEGSLWRSQDGEIWSAVNLGSGPRVQAMAGEGDMVLAVTIAKKRSGNLMLRSDDEGRHFYLMRELSHAGPVDNLSLTADLLRYRDRVSYDYGASWMPSTGAYWPGAVLLPDDSGLRLARFSSTRADDRLYIVGDRPDQWLLIETPVRENAHLSCEPASGCWLVAAHAIYRAGRPPPLSDTP